MYRSPKSNINIFLSRLAYLIIFLSKQSKSRIILAGDLNINILEIKLSKNVRIFLDILKKYNLSLHITEHTRHNFFASTIYSVIFTTLPLNYIIYIYVITTRLKSNSYQVFKNLSSRSNLFLKIRRLL